MNHQNNYSMFEMIHENIRIVFNFCGKKHPVKIQRLNQCYYDTSDSLLHHQGIILKKITIQEPHHQIYFEVIDRLTNKITQFESSDQRENTDLLHVLNSIKRFKYFKEKLQQTNVCDIQRLNIDPETFIDLCSIKTTMNQNHCLIICTTNETLKQELTTKLKIHDVIDLKHKNIVSPSNDYKTLNDQFIKYSDQLNNLDFPFETNGNERIYKIINERLGMEWVEKNDLKNIRKYNIVKDRDCIFIYINNLNIDERLLKQSL